MKTHFSDDEYAEEGICNIYSEEISNHWREVTCKKCLNLRDKYEALVIVEEQDIVNQMGGDFVEFHQKHKDT
jgi:hypothetical protein